MCGSIRGNKSSLWEILSLKSLQALIKLVMTFWSLGKGQNGTPHLALRIYTYQLNEMFNCLTCGCHMFLADAFIHVTTWLEHPFNLSLDD